MRPPNDLQCYIIGGSEADRFTIATRLRRNGVVTDFRHGPQDTAKRKRKAWERACSASIWEETVVYDLDKDDDRAYLSRPDAFLEAS